MLRPFSACAFAMLACLVTGTAHAQDLPDRRTIFTFNQPVVLPGVTLPAGTYVFRLADPSTDRHLLQVTSADRKTVYATFMARAVERPEPPTQPHIRFIEAPADMAPVVEAWWYPGSRYGWEFIYPREQALRIAEARRRGTPSPTPANTEMDR